VDLQEVKAHLRKTVLGRRDAMDAGTRAASSRAIVQGIIGLAAYKEARTILAYAAFGSELQTDAFLRHTLNEGKALLLPRVNRQKRLLEVYEVRDLTQDLEAGTWGIREPRPDRCVPAAPRVVDFVLVPGLAFDAHGGRLGHGAGYYDRLLSGGVSPHAWLVAGAFEAQMVEAVPMNEHDVPVDMVVTEKGRYPPGPPRRRTRHQA
jgi:5-formyltetrahydrofolate cyclo-ligase